MNNDQSLLNALTHSDAWHSLPPMLQEKLEPQLDRIGYWPDNTDERDQALHFYACSDFLVRVASYFTPVLQDQISRHFLSTPYHSGAHLAALQHYDSQIEDLGTLKKILRQYRQAAMFGIAWRDLSGQADLQETFLSLSELADASVQCALKHLSLWETQRFGQPRDSQGKALSLLVLGLGKLGGCELNYSSDIDLIFLFASAGETDGKKPISNEEFFCQLGRKLIVALDELTEDGFVFRVDMRLRPFGRSGPIAMSFAAAEHYYQAHGRTWERYAMIKARAIAGDQEDADEFFEMIRPFVYRRYLDFGSLEALREMKQMIAREMGEKGNLKNIKTGRGGIREVEFIGQALQLARGGKIKALQIRPIQQVLDTLKALDILPADTIDSLKESYCFLRKVENALQMMNDEQTHTLPDIPLNQERLARMTGFDRVDAFEAHLETHRNAVHSHFLASVSMDQENDPEQSDALEPYRLIWTQPGTRDSQLERIRQQQLEPADETLEAIYHLKQSTGYRILNENGRQRMNRLMPTILASVAETAQPAKVLMRIVQLLQKVISRSCYVALLTENPSALKHLIQLCAASPWIAEYLAHQPALFDDLLSPQTLYAPLRREELKIDLENRMTDCPADDIERQMEVLRRFLHTHRLRVAAADIVGEFPVMKVSDCLTETAEVILQKTLLLAWQTLSEKHGQPVCQNNGSSFTPEFLVVAYGKLGGIELGYSSDLDLVFIHNSRGEHQETTGPKVIDNTEFFMRLGKKVIHYLTTRTPAGILYEIDMRLRPSGNSGLLVVDIDSFAQYQRENAWTWEHQAIIRARPIAGSEAIAASFEEIRSEMINRPRNTSALRQEIVEMRRKMDELDRSMPDLFDLKLGKGGITDIEFIVQYLVLRWSSETPGLIRYTDNIRLLEGLGESQRLDQQTASLLMDAYRAYRSRVHHLALQQEKPLIPQSDLNEYKQAVCRIWTTLFNTERAPG